MKVGIRGTLVFTVGIFISIIVLASTSFSIWSRTIQETERLSEKAKLSATLQMTAIAQTMWDYDTSGTQKLIEAFNTDPDFAAAWIILPNENKEFEYIQKATTSDNSTVIQQELYHPQSDFPLGTLNLVMSHERLNALTMHQIIIGIIQFIITNTILIAVVFGSATRVTRPLNKLTELMKELAGGNNDLEIPYQSRRNEIGSIAKAVQFFKESAIEKQRMQEKQKEDEAKNQQERVKLLNNIAQGLEEQVGYSVKEVVSAINSLKQTLNQVESYNNDTNARCDNALQSSGESIGAIQGVNSATTEMTASISEIETQAKSSSSQSQEAVEKSNQAKTMVSALEESAKKIDDITALIRDVAEQTNLLALNATIEAARAGDAGKGFAVVANEVKNLAGQTSTASEDIAKSIAEIQSMIGETVSSIEEVTTIVETLSTSANTVETSMSEQGSAIREIAQNINNITSQSQNIQTNIESVVGTAQNMGESVTTSMQRINEIVDQIKKLDSTVKQSITTIRTA